MKKMQVFVSSTYEDLIEERQAAFEAILNAGHIPAGMELFTAGNESSLQTIHNWIDESDILMVILGGRYGSIEPKSKKSYTQNEYEYAVEHNIPVFAIILRDNYLEEKMRATSYANIMERDNTKKYNQFKKLLTANQVSWVNNCAELQNAVQGSLNNLINTYNLSGWIKDNIFQYFRNNLETCEYTYKRILDAKDMVLDFTWSDTVLYNPVTINEHTRAGINHDMLDTIEQVNDKVNYKEIFTFPFTQTERIEKMRKLINKKNYWCGFYPSNDSIPKFPKITFIIIDNEEVIFLGSCYNGFHCSIKSRELAGVLTQYYHECWTLCKVIKDHTGINKENLNEAIADASRV